MSHETDINMAAPTLDVGKGVNTKKKQGQTKTSGKNTAKGNKRPSRKNILLPPFQLEWPEVAQDDEDNILEALTEKLKEFPRLEPDRKRSGVTAKKKVDKDSLKETDDDLVRRRLRSQLALGHRQVTKGLERGQLSLVLVWRGAQPPLIVQSLLPLAASRACPALCLAALVPRATDATGLSSLVAVGFRKCQPGQDDFATFVAMATALAPPLVMPWTAMETAVEDNDDMVTDVSAAASENITETMEPTSVARDGNNAGEEKGTAECPAAIVWPVLTEEEEREVLQKLNKLLVQHKSVFKKPKPRLTSTTWKERRKVLRDNLITDLAAIDDAARCDRLALLLVQNDLDLPHATLTRAKVTAAGQGCPVLHAASLRQHAAPLIRNPILRALGFKKNPKEPKDKWAEEFAEFVTFATTFVSQDLQTLVPPILKIRKESDDSTDKIPEKATLDTMGSEDTEPKKDEQRKKQPIPFYDVAHLYVYKADAGAHSTTTTAAKSPTEADGEKGGTTQQKTADGFISLSQDPTEEAVGKKRKVLLSEPTETFISLSSEPTVEIFGPGSEGSKAASEPHFVDTAGDASNKKLATTVDPQEEEETGTDQNKGGSFQGVMGLDATEARADAAPFYPEARNSKVKASLKRKLDSSAAVGDFLTFKLQPTNVQTCISNPNKANKEKRGKKKKRK